MGWGLPFTLLPNRLLVVPNFLFDLCCSWGVVLLSGPVLSRPRTPLASSGAGDSLGPLGAASYL
jgi:hypothetical protein